MAAAAFANEQTLQHQQNVIPVTDGWKFIRADVNNAETVAFDDSKLAEPDLIELLQLDEAGFKSRFAATPILRAKRRGLLRNVCVALGNVGGDFALPALHKAAQDSEPLIAGHAQWAIEQIESR